MDRQNIQRSRNPSPETGNNILISSVPFKNIVKYNDGQSMFTSYVTSGYTSQRCAQFRLNWFSLIFA